MPLPLRSLTLPFARLAVMVLASGPVARAQGLVITPIGAGNRADSARTAALLPSGDLFVAGSAVVSYSPDHAAAFYPLQPAIGAPAVSTTYYYPQNDAGNADYASGSVALDDNNVVTAGVAYTYLDGGFVGNFALTWWRRSGAYRKVETVFNPNKKGKPTTKSRAVELLRGPDGSLIAVGVDEIGGTRLAFARYNPATGALLAKNQTNLGFEARGATLLGDAVYVVGRSFADDKMAVVKTNLNGQVATTWGTAGKVVLPLDASVAESAAVDASGRIVIVGSTSGEEQERLAALVRIRPDGQLDPTFGNAGIVTTDLGGSENSFSAVGLRANGLIVATGHASDIVALNPAGRFAAAQFLPDGSLDVAGFGTAGITIIPINESAFCHDAKIQADGRIVMVGEVKTVLAPGPPRTINLDFVAVQLDVFGHP